MVAPIINSTTTEIIYPESDGNPMADNTKQFRWIVTIKENLELLYAENPDVFVAGDLLWYPVEGNNTIRQAPDIMVAVGRPKGDRGSYQQWKEAGIAPQVVFEILSPGNRLAEMQRKLSFYERYGVTEYYIYDPDRIDFAGWMKTDDRLESIEEPQNWVSPRLGIRFTLEPDTLKIYRPDGQIFLSFVDLDLRRQAAEQRADIAEQRADTAEQRAAILAAKLQELGIDPTDL
ncbi:Uma2 family endonuclease [Chamaesiphon sp. VAR_69_metabat_338]|uniref:Uma2 family endonuclease n=1 Tax=Chamaesiphon sp. VAR_69_metabat_338 TaxID=2964704 RepID=UPI00286E1D09|nr:Uma2 family endonuclease [Chamaesiphon sp. VAR_69_metabat_338]